MPGARAMPFIAIILTAIALVPGGAHLLSLPNKIALPQEQYFVTQSIYNGWAFLGIVLIGAILADLGLAIVLRQQPGPFRLALTGFVLMLASLVIFFIWTFPTNQATANWTTVPENWEALRRQWEYSHAVNSLVTFAALCCIVLASLSARD